ncbi:1601058e-adee-4e23-937b-00d09fdffd74 [Sclerotinia trifoliorum]|uniref:1601058e-adee-4e23-937b-00d09fdffd74 n=1 Tax=Sclerotinia trifoliorum TaxID=28548 RepID=A0A8H2ZNI8_9HELO|nr:1601058e-adee-4e23-937b-00d09fdffd74 [Sclerotinia trifoliorum]
MFACIPPALNSIDFPFPSFFVAFLAQFSLCLINSFSLFFFFFFRIFPGGFRTLNMAPIILPSLSSHLFPTKVTNSTSFTKKPFSQSFDTLPTSLSSSSSSISLSKSPIPTVLPYLFHGKFSTVIVKAPTTTYTPYIELNNNGIASEPTALPDSTPVSNSFAVETQAPKPNNAGRDVGIVIVVGW